MKCVDFVAFRLEAAVLLHHFLSSEADHQAVIYVQSQFPHNKGVRSHFLLVFST